MSLSTDDNGFQKFVEIITDLLNSELSNIAVLESYDESPLSNVPKIVSTESDEIEISKLIQNISNNLGGVSTIVIEDQDGKKPTYDTFIDSVIIEILNTYYKTRRSLIKVSSQYMLVDTMIKNQRYLK